MSSMVISSVKRFIEMSKKLEDIGVKNIHFYNSQNNGELTRRMISLVPFVDFIVLGKDANLSRQLTKVVDEAFSRQIPVLSEDCLNELKLENFAVK